MVNPHQFFFSSSHGLRQGSPLSPLMLVIVMEALCRMISIVVSGGLLSDFSVGTRIDISHLLFVDNTLVFSGADPDLLRHLWCVFLCFEAVSGLKNLAKSELVPVGDVVDVDGLVGIMGCGVSPFAFEVSWSSFGGRPPTRPNLFGTMLLLR
jgi:hypothetical protein